jgi:4-hydroxybenzoate decarboxylase subunit C
MAFSDLRSFLRHLESRGDLRRIRVPVSADLEITEIATRVVKQEGPALLFENVEGSSFPLLINLLGAPRRIEWALGRAPGKIGEELRAVAEDLQPPKPSALWKHRSAILRALKMKPCLTSRAPVKAVSEAPDLDRLPILKCWPKDGGRFITFPLVITKSPSDGKRNTGIYRLQAFDRDSTGMHWQIEKGGGFHYAEAERRGEPLPVAVVLGADPVLMMAGILPLPEGMDELAFAGFLRGAATRLTKLEDDRLEVPAEAEMVLEGVVPLHEKRTEGPFGDHFGHYSHAAPFPVFRARRFHRRPDAIYAAAVVGKPPQEDKHMGNAVQEMLLPLLKIQRPELVDLWSYFETGFHNLAVASVRQRYAKEGLKTALALLGQGQFSLTKCLILVDPDVNVRHFAGVLDALRKNFDPKDDFTLLPATAQDTLDFTGPAMNLGSKMILDATSGSEKGTKSPVFPRGAGEGVGEEGGITRKNWRDAVLVARLKGEGSKELERLVKDPALARFKLIFAVSDDVPLDDEELLLWGIFTRFDCARDFVPAKATFRGGVPVYEGPLGFDSTWKTGYPEPLVMDPEIVKKVDRRWNEYGIG